MSKPITFKNKAMLDRATGSAVVSLRFNNERTVHCVISSPNYKKLRIAIAERHSVTSSQVEISGNDIYAIDFNKYNFLNLFYYILDESGSRGEGDLVQLEVITHY